MVKQMIDGSWETRLVDALQVAAGAPDRLRHVVVTGGQAYATDSYRAVRVGGFEGINDEFGPVVVLSMEGDVVATSWVGIDAGASYIRLVGWFDEISSGSAGHSRFEVAPLRSGPWDPEVADEWAYYDGTRRKPMGNLVLETARVPGFPTIAARLALAIAAESRPRRYGFFGINEGLHHVLKVVPSDGEVVVDGRRLGMYGAVYLRDARLRSACAVYVPRKFSDDGRPVSVPGSAVYSALRVDVAAPFPMETLIMPIVLPSGRLPG